MLGVERATGRDLVEVAADSHHPEMLGGELDLGVHRIELPGAHRNVLFGGLFVAHGATNRLEAPLISPDTERGFHGYTPPGERPADSGTRLRLRSRRAVGADGRLIRRLGAARQRGRRRRRALTGLRVGSRTAE